MSSEPATIQFQSALKKAYTCKWQLPKFQRPVKWKRKQNMLLFDSLRCEYPIGTFLTAKQGAINSKKPLKFTDKSKGSTEPESLLLDGQQRITAGLQLFYADNNLEDQSTFYFIDLIKLEEIVEKYKIRNPHFKEDCLSDIDKLGEDLDIEDGYLKPAIVKDPYSCLIKKGLVFTALLRHENKRKLIEDLLVYEKADESKKAIVLIFNRLFDKTYDPIIPNIVIESKQPRILTRIFSTLNNTGTSLTPFEITVSEMFGKGVDIQEDISKLSSNSRYYDSVDRDRNLILQASLLISGQSDVGHKKTDLPKNLNADIWNKNKNESIKSIEALGQFLDELMKTGITRKNNSYIPYDTALLPLVYLFSRFNSNSHRKKATLHKIAKFYFIYTALSLRFTEGAAGKQSIDKSLLVDCVKSDSFSPYINGIKERFSGLDEKVTKSGAKGKAVLIVQSANGLKDPLSMNPIDLSRDHELHHIFPKDFLKKIAGRKELSISEDHICNLMITEPNTNNKFRNQDPKDQIEISSKDKINIYSRHFIDEEALEILQRKDKGVQDYYDFIKRRSESIIQHLKSEYEINCTGENTDEIDSDEDAD
jgi:uncharacterized protein with ParB-like and HNH nuclease domain